MSIMKGKIPIQTKVPNKCNTDVSSKQIDGGVTEKRERNGEGSERREGSIVSFYTVTLHGHLNVFLHGTISAKI